MASLTITPTQGYAHCRDPRCAGTEQEEVPAQRHITEWTYLENGGNMPGVERSTEMVTFADETQAPCPTCGVEREVTGQVRPRYTPLSGHRQDGLLLVKQFDAGAQPAGNDAIVAQLMAQVAALSAQIAGQAPAPAAVAEPDAAELERLAEAKRRSLEGLAKGRAKLAAKRASVGPPNPDPVELAAKLGL